MIDSIAPLFFKEKLIFAVSFEIMEGLIFMNKNSQLKIVIGIVLAGAIIFFAGFYIGGKFQTQNVSAQSVLNKEAMASTTADFAPFWQVWKTLENKFVATHAQKTVTDQDKVWGAIQGLASSYGDPYTVFFPPDESKSFNEEIQGNFEGVGMEVGIKGNVLTVVAPLKNNPAYQAGIKSGDQIIKINGTSTASLSVDEAVNLIRGPKGTKVVVTVVRNGVKDPIDFTLIRETIEIPTLDTETLSGGIFVIHLYNFSQNSADLFRGALRQFVSSGSHKLVLDLRDNPGGYLEAAVDMASWFLPMGKTVVTEDFGSTTPQDTYKSYGYNIFNKNLQFEVLVNGGSASASEILAGALQQYGVAKLIGEQTFGKGSVQELVPITSDTSLKVTVARWLTPNGTWISEKGLTPDIVVPLVADKNNPKKDAQMDRAVAELQKLP
jgi:carboxyl-terminal processing protease